MNRRLLPLLFLFSAMVLAACGGATPAGPDTDSGDDAEVAEPADSAEGDTDAGDAESDTSADDEASAGVGGEVEIFSWWTGGGEAAGLDAMIEVFNQQNPDIEFVNAAVAGGAGTNARAVLATRLQAGDPPDSWQGHAGQELIGTYVVADQIQPLNEMYEANGWIDVMPDTLIPLISADDNIYSVPVNIHRANVMWTNPSVLEQASVEPPTTWDEFFTACEAIEAMDLICLSMGEQWTAMHLMEVVLLGELGPDAYSGLWSGETDWASEEVTSALETFSQVLDHVNDDASALSWQDAAQLVASSDAAFNIMGDWVDGYFSGTTDGGNLGLTPGEGYGWAPPPGTDGLFQFLSDSFVLPISAPNPEGAEAWLNVAGSKEGQEAFNPVKGSICARTDCDASLFNEYLQSAMEDWSSDTVVGSLTHGVVANDSWKSEIDTSLGLFLGDRSIENLQSGLAAACSSSGACQ